MSDPDRAVYVILAPDGGTVYKLFSFHHNVFLNVLESEVGTKLRVIGQCLVGSRLGRQMMKVFPQSQDSG